MTFDYGFFIGAAICILIMILYKVYFWKDVDTTFHRKQEKKKTAE